jgi:hypothetical protein
MIRSLLSFLMPWRRTQVSDEGASEEARWQAFMRLAPTTDDLLLILEERHFYSDTVRRCAAIEFLRAKGSVDVSTLNMIIVEMQNIDPVLCRQIAHRVLIQARSSDELGQVMVSVPELAAEAARRVLAGTPKTYELMRCLEIREVAA